MKHVVWLSDSPESDTSGDKSENETASAGSPCMKKGADGFVRRRLGMRKYGSAFVWVEGPSEMHHPREPLA